MTFERSLLFFDLPFIFLLTALILGLLFTRPGVSRYEGLFILACYGAYVGVKLLQFQPGFAS